MTRYLQLMKTLPPLVSVVVWDVTIQVAQATSKEEFERYDVPATAKEKIEEK